MSLKLLGNVLKRALVIRPTHSTTSLSHLSRKNVATVSNGLVEVKNGTQSSTYNTSWLRENCQCSDCFTHSTQQRNVLFYEANSEISTINDNGKSLNVQWQDGHKSEYSLKWLEQNSNPRKPPPKTLWNAEILKASDFGGVNYDRFMESDEGLKEVLQSLWTYGIGLVTGAPLTDMELVKRISFVQETFFGGFWTFTADQARGDTAYTNIALGAHTDSTYLTSPAGIQVFHCLEHDGEGGETLLVDGFHAAHTLRQQDPDAFRILTSTPMLHQYREPGVHTESVHNILNVCPWDDSLQSICYNHYDRAPLPPPGDPAHHARFYAALARLSALITDPQAEHWLKLRGGAVLFIDNWRVLHGRAAFTGRRTVTGCYLPRDDWLSRARDMGVL